MFQEPVVYLNKGARLNAPAKHDTTTNLRSPVTLRWCNAYQDPVSLRFHHQPNHYLDVRCRLERQRRRVVLAIRTRQALLGLFPMHLNTP